MPITCDSGAQISVVPEECVEGSEFTGDSQTLEDFHTGKVTGRVCNVVFEIAGRKFPKKAVTLPGELLRWTPCMVIPLAPRTEMDFILEQMAVKEASDREETRYLLPELEGDLLISGLMVSEGVVVHPKPVKTNSVKEPVVIEKASNPGEEALVKESEKETVEVEDSVEVEKASEEGSKGGDWDEGDERASVLEEVEGVILGGSAEEEVDDLILTEGVQEGIPRDSIAQAILEDKFLKVARDVAELQRVGYFQKEGIVFRARIDALRSTTNQICLPQPYRQKCLALAHTQFGHQGRNKMVALIK